MHTPAVLAFVGTASAAAHIGSSSLFHNGWMPYEPAEITTYLNSTILTTPSTAEFTYPGTGLDGPKVHPVNGTNFDWWYFDAVSDDLPNGDLSSVIIVFYTLSQTAFFGQRQNDSVLAVSIAGTLRDGTRNYINLQPGEATITTLGDSSAGQWGSGPNNASWSSSPDLRTWVVTSNNEIVNGSLTMTSIAPPHLPCGLPTPLATELIIPHVGWVNAVPTLLRVWTLLSMVAPCSFLARVTMTRTGVISLCSMLKSIGTGVFFYQARPTRSLQHRMVRCGIIGRRRGTLQRIRSTGRTYDQRELHSWAVRRRQALG
ncbi:hypothetical protein LTR10_009622 [Elasticomyces elasticus]|nr:hypothetical protein LTR10_009622 [Elasticomyces elasticus]